jgi:16S rRNA (cytidine1402-2'-O)-methyltransferase
MPGTLFVVATPIGNLDDITGRALRVLRDVTVIAAEDTRRTAHLLARYAISTPTTSLHEHNEAGKTPELVDRLRRGDHVALVSDAGTPTVSDPGRRLIRAAVDAGIRVEPIPGASAALAALAASGFPADTFHFLGFPPTRSKDRNKWFDQLRALEGTVVFFEAPHRIQATLDRLRQTVGDCSIVVGRELTKIHEELVRGPISVVSESLKAPKGEFTVVAEIGLMTEFDEIAAPGEHQIANEFGELTNKRGVTRRSAISTLAKKYGRSSREIYAAIERAKKSVM